MTPPRPDSGRHLAVAAGALVLLVHLLDRLALPPWDDAHFFRRVSHNLLDHGVLAWNVAEGAVYGNTSQGFQLLSALSVAVLPSHSLTVVKIAAAVTLFALVARRNRAPALGLAVVAMPAILLILHSGMETPLALLMVALAVQLRDRPWTGAILTAAVYAVRPDAALIPVLLAILERRIPWRGLLLIGAMVGGFWLYFGSALPLSFALKSSSFSPYSDAFIQGSRPLKVKNALTMAALAAPLVLIGAFGAWRVLTAGLTFWAYHLISTVEVMGYQMRFYLPGFVAVGIAAVEGLRRFQQRVSMQRRIVLVVAWAVLVAGVYWGGWIWTGADRHLVRMPLTLIAGYTLGVGLIVVEQRRLAVAAIVLGSLLNLSSRDVRLASDDAMLRRAAKQYTSFRGLHTIKSCFDEPVHLYHTEIGVPGGWLLDSTITDMAGLMNEDIARNGLNFEQRCQKEQPDFIFLPHKNYNTLREETEQSRCLTEGYAQMVAQSSAPLFVRTDLTEAFTTCEIHNR
ncbi:MAG: hypothetical protein AAFV53_00895 [Myxococcota bacterium]